MCSTAEHDVVRRAPHTIMRSNAPHESRSPRHAARLALALSALLVSLGAAVYAFGAPFAASPVGGSGDLRPASHAARTPHRGTLEIRAWTPRRTVAPGGTVAYRFWVHRGGALILPRTHGRRRLAAPVRLRIIGRPREGIVARLRPTTTRSSPATLSLRTRKSTPDGTYRVRIEARARLHPRAPYRIQRARTVLTLVVATPHRRRFAIHGTLPGLLSPGTSAPIDLRLTNPHRTKIRVRELAVRVTGVHAPEANVSRPCTTGDFTVAPLSSAQGPITLPASSTRTLSALGVTTSRWPRVGMANRPVNQDGCKHARLTLGFTGVATEGGR